MQFRALSKSLMCLFFATVSAAAWNMHILGAHHDVGEDCQVCAVAAAPQLNVDCGTALLSRLEKFSLLKPEAPLASVFTVTASAFYSRAPPAA